MASASPLLTESLLSSAAVLLFALTLLSIIVAVYSLRNLTVSPLGATLPLILIAAVLQIVFTRGPGFFESRINHSRAPLPSRYHSLALSAPEDLTVADLHSDALFWFQRDLNLRGTTGHVDIPRLVEGGVVIQIFALVIAVPRGLNVESNAPPASLLDDHVFAKMLLERWPAASWQGYLNRALVQCERLHRVAARSEGVLKMARVKEDLDAGRGEVRGLLALEGASALEGNVGNLDTLFRAGLRVLGVTHFFDTEMGGSMSGVDKGGLTKLGREVVERMVDLRMIVDVAHASDKVIEDLVAMERKPCVMLSHTGVRSICESQRNVDDKHLRMIAEMDGIIGIALFYPALCDTNDLVGSFVKSVVHAISIVGVNHVALGSDWDGAVVTSVDASQTKVLYGALLRDGGLSEDNVKAVLHRNAAEFLGRCLP